MIDIHSHILPSVDDGAKTIEDSINMARVANRIGITRIIATPHYGNGRFQVSLDEINSRIGEVKERLLEERIPIELSAGHEVRINRYLIEDVQNGNVLTLANSNYLLVELPSNEIPKYTNEIFHELILMGIIPIIAHPERNIEISNHPDKLHDLVELGALTQLTSHSIIGLFGKKIASSCVDLCNRNLVHFIANDAHDIETRGFSMLEAYRLLARTYGLGYVEYLKQNAFDVLNNNNIVSRFKVEPASRWTKWFGK